MSGPWGCYVHVPWCRVHCPYCAFYVVTGEPSGTDRFVERVLEEWSLRRTWFEGPAHTLYLGGGTPSRLAPSALARLVQGIERAPDAEVTAEANPEDLTEDWLTEVRGAGIDRISLGVQSFIPRVARRLGRGHTQPQAVDAVARLQAAPLRSWSLDLIFAVPGQTMADLDADLDIIVDTQAPHVSLYGLTIEPGTPFARAHRRGSLPEVPEDHWHDMYSHIVARLQAAGLVRYEISNFARPGHESRHNTLYWTDQPYLGLGPAAHSYRPDGARWANPRDLREYLTSRRPALDIEHPTPRQAAADLLVSGLRGVTGLSRARLTEKTGLAVHPDTVRILVQGKLLVEHGDRMALGPRGFALADGVARRLLDTLIEEGASTSGGPGPLG